MSNRKVHNDEEGYIGERMNPFIRQKVVIYYAEHQGIDAGGQKYAVVCDAHGTIVGESSLPKARISMKNPDNFCDSCRKLKESQ